MNKQNQSQMNTKNENQVGSLVAALSAQDLGLQAPCCVDVSYAIWIRALMQNWRQGTVGCKTRGEVSFSNKKPWKQKGTGRARAGSARSPLWRGGGVLFGPQPRVRNLKVNKQTKSQVLAACMTEYADQGKILALNWALPADKPSTALMHQAMQQAGLAQQKLVMFLDRQDYAYWSSVNNLQYIHVVSFDDINAYELSLGSSIVVLQKDLSMMKDMVAKWN